MTERVASGTNPLSLAALDSSPEGRALGRTGEFRPPFVNGRKKPAVKLQTFRLCQSLSLSGEVARRSRDGEGCLPEQTLSVSLRSTALPKGEPLAEPESFVLHSSTAGRSQPISGKLYALAKASPFRERWHGEAVTERVAFRNEPSQSRCARQLVPLFVACGDIFPRPGEVFRRASPWQRGQVSSLFVNGRKKPPLSCKLYALAKASPFRERWHGEAVTERAPPRLTAAFGKQFFHGPAERPSSLESRY